MRSIFEKNFWSTHALDPSASSSGFFTLRSWKVKPTTGWDNVLASPPPKLWLGRKYAPKATYVQAQDIGLIFCLSFFLQVSTIYIINQSLQFNSHQTLIIRLTRLHTINTIHTIQSNWTLLILRWSSILLTLSWYIKAITRAKLIYQSL